MLLNNEEGANAIIQKLSNAKGVLSATTYFAGIVGLVFITMDHISPRTYFSENALLPGAVETNYVDTGSAEKFANLFYEKQKMDRNQQLHLIRQQMLLFGLDVFEQYFNVSGKHTIEGVNLHGILTSQRTAGVEALILHFPLREDNDGSAGIGLLLSLVKYFSEQSYWAKNIIFLVTQGGNYGLKSWLSSYHGDSLPGITWSPFEGYGGVIQAALVIELDSPFANNFFVNIEGSNGLLPNLDLVNLVLRICRSLGLNVQLQTEIFKSYSSNDVDQLVSYSRNLFAMMAVQASGFSTGCHGEYFHYRIEALTIQGKGQSGGRAQLLGLGRAIESVFRSLNSLLEQFHQSFFFYILANHRHFISIGLYMIPFGLLLVGPAIQAILCWNEVTTENLIKSSTTDKGASRFLEIITVPVFTQAMAYFAYSKLFSEDSKLTVSVEFCCVTCAVIAVSLRSVFSTVGHNRQKTQRLITNLYLILASLTVAMFNFSLGYFIALTWCPFCIFPSDLMQYNIWRLLRFCVCLCVSPPAALVGICFLYRTLVMDHLPDFDSAISSLWQANQLLAFAIEHQSLGVWTLQIATLVLFPLWTLLAIS